MDPRDWLPPYPPGVNDDFNEAHRKLYDECKRLNPNASWRACTDFADNRMREAAKPAEVMPLRPGNPETFRNIAAAMRSLATQLGRGEFGIVESAAIVIRITPSFDAPRDDISVFGMGPKSDELADYALLHAGADYLLHRRFRTE